MNTPVHRPWVVSLLADLKVQIAERKEEEENDDGRGGWSDDDEDIGDEELGEVGPA